MKNVQKNKTHTDAVFPPSFRRECLDDDLEDGATANFGVGDGDFVAVAL
jgi:hypothetical protein